MVDAAAYNAVATSVLAILSFLLGSWRGRRGEVQPVASARSAEACECLFSGCSPTELKEQLEVLQDLSWWKGLAIGGAVLIGTVVLLAGLWFGVIAIDTARCCCRTFREARASVAQRAPVSAAGASKPEENSYAQRVADEVAAACQRAAILDSYHYNRELLTDKEPTEGASPLTTPAQRRPRKGPARPSDFR